MVSIEEVQTLLNGGGAVVGDDGTKIGDVAQVYLDDASGEPEWVTTKAGMFSGGESFIPLAQANVQGNEIRVPYSKDKVKGAPSVSDSDGHVSGEDEAELYSYYGLSYSFNDDSELAAGNATVDAAEGTTRDVDAVGHDTSGPTTDDAMTRSEETLVVGTQSRVAGRARLVKYTVTEEKTITVPVTRTEVRVEYDDADGTADTAGTGTTTAADSSVLRSGDSQSSTVSGGGVVDDSDDGSGDMILTEERVVVTKETVPVKRVRLAKEAVTTEEQVTDTVRKERIETEGVDETRSP
jgi:stress response protein YsnF